MKDYIAIFEHYKDIKENVDIIDEVIKLREFYMSQQFDEMHKHI